MEMGKVYPGGFEYEPHMAKIVLLQMQQTVRNTGAIIVAKDAYQVDESVGSVESGEFPVQFDSENVEEVR